LPWPSVRTWQGAASEPSRPPGSVEGPSAHCGSGGLRSTGSRADQACPSCRPWPAWVGGHRAPEERQGRATARDAGPGIGPPVSSSVRVGPGASNHPYSGDPSESRGGTCGHGALRRELACAPPDEDVPLARSSSRRRAGPSTFGDDLGTAPRRATGRGGAHRPPCFVRPDAAACLRPEERLFGRGRRALGTCSRTALPQAQTLPPLLLGPPPARATSVPGAAQGGLSLVPAAAATRRCPTPRLTRAWPARRHLPTTHGKSNLLKCWPQLPRLGPRGLLLLDPREYADGAPPRIGRPAVGRLLHHPPVTACTFTPAPSARLRGPRPRAACSPRNHGPPLRTCLPRHRPQEEALWGWNRFARLDRPGGRLSVEIWTAVGASSTRPL